MIDNIEEKEKLSEGEKLLALTKSDGWSILMDRYKNIINSISDLRNIPSKIKDGDSIRELTEAERLKEMQRREGSLSLLEALFNGIMADIEEYNELINNLNSGKNVDEILEQEIIVRY